MRVLLVLAMTGTASAQTIDETIPPTIRLSRASDVEIERGEARTGLTDLGDAQRHVVPDLGERIGGHAMSLLDLTESRSTALRDGYGPVSVDISGVLRHWRRT